MAAEARATATQAPVPAAVVEAPVRRVGRDERTAVASTSRFDLTAVGTSGSEVQRKTALDEPGDALEREADQAAERVMRMPDAAPGRIAAPWPREHARRTDAAVPAIRRRAASNAAAVSPDAVDRAAQVAGSGGMPLPAPARAFFEPRFGCDFSGVRVHTDSGAAQAAHAIRARAYAFGRDIVFAAGAFEPASVPGRYLLAHELAHVVQQGGARTGAAARVARAPEADAAAPEEAKPATPQQAPDTRDYARLADIVFKAIHRLGTDEDAVYRALGELNREAPAIAKLKQTYAQRHPGDDLVADIRDDFSGSELEYALQLINLGDPNSAQHIEAAADLSAAGLERAARRLHDAFEVFLGTDEEAVYAVLVPFKRDPAALTALQTAYRNAFREDLTARLFDEFSGEELDYVLFLYFTPQQAYEYYLKQAARELSGGVPGGRAVGGEQPDDSAARYDRSRWETGNPVNEHGVATMAALHLRKGQRPSEAIQAMYDSMTQSAPTAYLFGSWRADCAEWVQVHHLYAMLKVLGPYRFDQRFGGKDFWFRNHRSTGLKARAIYSRQTIGEKLKPLQLENGDYTPNPNTALPDKTDPNMPERDAEELLREAPVGSRVAWFNQAIRSPGSIGLPPPDPDAAGFAVENSMKIGPDLYSAHGFGLRTRFTRKQLVEASLSYGSNPHLSREQNAAVTVFVGEIEIYDTLGAEPWQP
jgi:hypothetical protein